MDLELRLLVLIYNDWKIWSMMSATLLFLVNIWRFRIFIWDTSMSRHFLIILLLIIREPFKASISKSRCQLLWSPFNFFILFIYELLMFWMGFCFEYAFGPTHSAIAFLEYFQERQDHIHRSVCIVQWVCLVYCILGFFNLLGLCIRDKLTCWDVRY